VLRTHSRSSRRTDRPIGHAKTVVAGHDREVACHHVSTAQLRRAYAPHGPRTTSEAFRRHAGNALAQAVVDEHAVKIGELITGMQGCDALMKVIDVGDVDVRDIYDSKVLPETAPPGTEEVAGPDRKPTNRAESESDPEAHASAKSEEGDVCGRPNRTVRRVDRTRPPGP
jgi:hypothetical protein